MVKQSTKKTTKKAAVKKTNTVDFEPNKMGLAVAATASVSLVLLAVIATQS